LDNVRVSFDATQVLRGISLSIARGEVVALLGANGSGKTTLVKAMLGIVPASGTISLFGEPLGRTVDWDAIGYVPQRASATTGVPTTPLEVVASGLLSAGHLRSPRGARARALQALATMGLAARATHTVAELSGGQQQRVLIARALVKNPSLLVLDEPNTGLDADSQEALVTALTQRTGPDAPAPMTVIVVLHETGPYAPLITRSVVLRDGEIAADEPVGPISRATSPADHSPSGAALHDPAHPHGDPHHAHPGPTPPPRTPDLEW
jgi:zinc transport system ATP-binding protein